MFLSATPPACHAAAPDRSLGEDGWLLRLFVTHATAPRAGRDDFALRLIAKALERAEERDGTLIRADAFDQALELLQTVPAHIPLPRVVVESDTELGLDWDESRRRVVSLTVDGSRTVGYSALIGNDSHYGTFQFDKAFPAVLSFLLGRIYGERAR